MKWINSKLIIPIPINYMYDKNISSIKTVPFPVTTHWCLNELQLNGCHCTFDVETSVLNHWTCTINLSCTKTAIFNCKDWLLDLQNGHFLLFFTSAKKKKANKYSILKPEKPWVYHRRHFLALFEYYLRLNTNFICVLLEARLT